MSHESGNDLQQLSGVVEYSILTVLGATPRTGLGIFEAVAQRTNNQLILVPDTLYANLKRMYEQRWIDLADPPVADQSQPERRKYYQLTAVGHNIIQQQIAWMEAELSQIYTQRAQVLPVPPTTTEPHGDEQRTHEGNQVHRTSTDERSPPPSVAKQRLTTRKNYRGRSTANPYTKKPAIYFNSVKVQWWKLQNH